LASGKPDLRPLDSAVLALRFPASVLRVWGADERRREQIREHLVEECDAVALDGDAMAIVPKPGDPAVFDAGLHWSRRVLTMLESSAIDGPRILISPAELLLRGNEVLGLFDDVAEDIAERPPDLRPNNTYLTTWAAETLETSWDLRSSGAYRGPSGREVPLVQVLGRKISTAPWRNPGLLGRKIESTARPDLQRLLEDHLKDTVVRVTGPPGCGKSRLVWELLQSKARMFLWLQAHPERRRALTLAQQIEEQLLEPHDDQDSDPLHPQLDVHRKPENDLSSRASHAMRLTRSSRCWPPANPPMDRSTWCATTSNRSRRKISSSCWR
jgi:hypothetical protein